MNKLFYGVGVVLLLLSLGIAYVLTNDSDQGASPPPSADQGLRINP